MAAMHLLLDTHALLWAVSAPDVLSEQARVAIGCNSNIVAVSVASLWELRIKESIGKLRLPTGFYEQIANIGYEILAIKMQHIRSYGELPMIHRDPFDRMLVAQAQVERLTLITRDSAIGHYDIQTLQA